MIMIIVNLHFLSYVIFYHQLQITCRKSSGHPFPLKKKIHFPLFTQSPPPKNSKTARPPFCQHLKFFSPPPTAERGKGGSRTL